MTNLIDKRATKLNTTFENLENGDFFEDTTTSDIAIKTGACTALYYGGGSWIPYHADKEELVVPLKATITIEREEKENGN